MVKKYKTTKKVAKPVEETPPAVTGYHVEYSSNNSGGGWWLKDEDWKNLEAAGWVVEWRTLCHITDDGNYARDENGIPKLITKEEADKLGIKRIYPGFGADKDGRWLGALATCAYKVCSEHDFMKVVEEWESVTGKDAGAAGCPCCGNPHSFTLYDSNGRSLKYGPTIKHSASWE